MTECLGHHRTGHFHRVRYHPQFASLSGSFMINYHVIKNARIINWIMLVLITSCFNVYNTAQTNGDSPAPLYSHFDGQTILSLNFPHPTMNKHLSSQNTKTQFERHRACVSGQIPQALGGCRPLRTLAKHSVLHLREEKLPHLPPPHQILENKRLLTQGQHYSIRK